MAGFDDGEDPCWDDDDLDAIPGDQLAELEQNAIQFTQHQTQGAFTAPPSSDYGDEFEDEELDDSVVYDESRGIPPQLQSLNTHRPGPSTQRELFRMQRYGAAGNVHEIQNRPPTEQWQSASKPVPQLIKRATTAVPAQLSTTTNSSTTIDVHDVDNLQRQVQELLQAQELLKQELSAKAGENAIIRSKQVKQAMEHERELTSIRQLNAEKLAAQQRAIEAAREAEKTKATELEFAKKDLLEEAEKVRNLKRSKLKDKPITAETVTTPKKNKSATHRDGFEDDEVQLISPSKFAGRRSNGGTPTKAGFKRKRKVNDSPIAALRVEHEESMDDKVRSDAPMLDEALVERLKQPDDRLDFLGAMLDHCPPGGKVRTMEEFAKLSFPGSGDESFVSMVFERLPGMRQSASELPIVFCELIISIWSRCLDTKFYDPIHLLIDFVSFALELKTIAIAPFIIDTLLPVVQSTADLIAVPRFQRAKYDHVKKDIDVSACLELMLLAAQGCINDFEHKTRFWRLVRLDFVLMILSQHQHVEDFCSMLQLLSMSTMRESVGPKAIDQESQKNQMEYILDRISLMLVAHPTAEVGHEKHERSVVADLRLQILHTLEAFCQVPWGGEALSRHRFVIGRLVKVMSDELDCLYDFKAGHKQSAHLICLSTRVLHYLVTKHDATIKMQEKLSVIHGGHQKYLIGLARLHYAENDLVLEAHINPEVSECAHEMLELAVTPEEGDAIHATFSGG